MLVNEIRVLESDFILAAIADGRGPRVLAKGVYEIGHFGGSHWLTNYDHYPPGLPISAVGVADSWQQVLLKAPVLQQSMDRKFIVTVTPIIKSEQPASGGWRWHKWGPYIGNYEPTTEYLYDEPDIEKVYVYHIYERQDQSSGRYR